MTIAFSTVSFYNLSANVPHDAFMADLLKSEPLSR